MPAHTPGPWHVESEPFNIWDAHGHLVGHAARACFNNDAAWDRMIVNARLMAAAPELLAACEAAKASADHFGTARGCGCGADLRGNVWYCDEANRLRAEALRLVGEAISKAKGE